MGRGSWVVLGVILLSPYWVIPEIWRSQQIFSGSTRSHKGELPVNPIFQAICDSGDDQSNTVVSSHKAGKPFDPTSTDTGSGSKSSQSEAGAQYSVVQLKRLVNQLAPRFSLGLLIPGCQMILPLLASCPILQSNPGQLAPGSQPAMRQILGDLATQAKGSSAKQRLGKPAATLQAYITQALGPGTHSHCYITLGPGAARQNLVDSRHNSKHNYCTLPVVHNPGPRQSNEVGTPG